MTDSRKSNDTTHLPSGTAQTLASSASQPEGKKVVHLTQPLKDSVAKRFGRGFVFLWFMIGGIAHFVATDTEVRLVPPYIPWPLAAVWVSGAFELLGAGGLLFMSTRRLAGMGLFALTVCVTPVHIYMLQRPDLFSVPYWALILRLPLQVILLALITWCTIRNGRS